ncbi:MAG: calcium/sodium antiporter [Alphaproteobacteria bacterium]|nr:calcium/sodium antiporter [Alphaproteobacteria bacterium]
MLTDFFYIVSGLVLLFFGGEWLVKGSVGVAVRFGISTLLVSLVIIGFGTSAPELIVSLQAALTGSPEISLGNVVGSNIANILLIVGFAAAISPIASGTREIRRNSLIVIVASLALCLIALMNELDRIGGILMVMTLVGYIVWSYFDDKKATPEEVKELVEARAHATEDVPEAPKQLWQSVAFIVAGLVFLALGANWLVTGATSVARAFNISEAVIGLTLVAIGTSLPELATAVVAAMKKHADVVIGNVLGSNLFNIFFILGSTAIVTPLPLTGRIAEFDVWLALVVAVILYPVIKSGHVIDRREGVVLLILYAAYIAAMFVF